MYRFPWYLTLVSTNHALSNPGQMNTILFQDLFRHVDIYLTIGKLHDDVILHQLPESVSLLFCYAN